MRSFDHHFSLWIQISRPLVAGEQFFEQINFSITNTGSVNQTVRVTCETVPLIFAEAKPNTITLKINDINSNPTTEVISVSPIDTVIAPGASARGWVNAKYMGPAPAGFYHLVGGATVTIRVQEDRGTVSGILRSLLESNAADAFSVGPISQFASLRNTLVSIPLNGGRPF